MRASGWRTTPRSSPPTTTALELATAAKDANTSELQASAIRYLILAGDRALGMEVQAAERHYAKALELAPEGHPERPVVLARHGEALRQRGRLPEAGRAFEEAIESFRARGDVRAMALSMGRFSMVLHWLGDPRHREITVDAVAALEPLGPSPELTAALADRAGTSFVLGGHREAIAFADRAIALASELGLPEPARALGFRGAARALLGDSGGLEDMRRALEEASAQGLGREVALLHLNLSEAIGPIEGPRARLEASREGTAFAERRGIEGMVLALACSRLEALVDLGFYEEGAALAAEFSPRLVKAGDVVDLIQARSSQIRLLTRRGEHAEALPLAAWAVERTRELGELQDVALAFPPAARVHLDVGDATTARALLAELEGTRNVRDELAFVWNLPDAVRAALAAGDPDLAERLTQGVEPIYPLHEHALVTARALLRENRGEHAEAAEFFSDAAGRWEGFEMPWEHAQALLGQGRCLLALGQSTEAAEALRSAREVFVKLGARPALENTDALLREATALTS